VDESKFRADSPSLFYRSRNSESIPIPIIKKLKSGGLL